MRKLILKMSMTLDGFVCGPNGEFDWFLKTRSEDGMAWTMHSIAESGALLIGRKSFESMAPFWIGAQDGSTNPMNVIPKIVFSKNGYDPTKISPTPNTWTQAQVATGDLAAQIRALKERAGKYLFAIGGANFAQSLAATGLVDEFWLVRHPVVIGRGRELFSGLKESLFLNMVETKSFSSGTLVSIYRA